MGEKKGKTEAVEFGNTKTIRELIDNSAAVFKDRPYLKYENNDLIYEISFEHFAGLCRIVGSYMNRLRTEKGHVINVALFGSSSHHYLPVLLGVMGSGNVAVPLDVQMDAKALADSLIRSDVDILFYDWDNEPVVEQVKDKCPKIMEYYSLQSVKKVPCLNDILRDERFPGDAWSLEQDEDKAEPEDLAMILFTSGTSGKSKGVMLTNGNLTDNVFSQVSPEPPGEVVYLSVLPIHHVFAINCDFLIGLSVGATICLNGPLNMLAKHLMMFEPTVIHMVPMIAKALYNKIVMMAEQDRELTPKDILHRVYGKNLSRIVCGGGGLPEDLALKYVECGVMIGQGYGMSECAPLISSPDYTRPDKVTSAGKVVMRCEVRVQNGELQVKSPSVMKGYYKEPELTKEAFTEDGWLRTGDAGYVDEEGFIYLTGRIKNLIVLSNGENVAPEELEGLFATQPVVQEIVVFGEDDVLQCEIYPDFRYAESIGVTDVLTELENVVKRINETLPGYKRILRTSMRKVPFVKTSSRKIIRGEFEKERAARKHSEDEVRLPENEDQKKIYDACVHCLGHRRFGIDTDLFTCGLDSFASIMLLTALQEKCGFSLTLTELMEHPTVEKLAVLKDEKGGSSDVDYTVREVYPLTKLQMYFAYVMRGNTTANLPFFFKLDGKVDLDRMEEAIRELFKVHPVLNDVIQPGEDGRLANFRDDNREAKIERMSLSDAEWEEKRRTLLVPYMYGKGETLYHIGLYETPGSKYMLFDVAHIIGDGMTMNILLEDLNSIYMGREVKKSDYTFYEYILDEYDREAKGLRDKDIAFFKELLNGYKIDKSILAKKDSYDLNTAHNAVLRGRFKSLDLKTVKGYCSEYGVSENALFLTAFSYVVSLYGYGDDTVITSIHNGRTDGRWIRLAGSLFATYLFRYKRVPHETVEELVHRSADQILHTMECHMSSQHADEMFIQYQGDLLDIPQLGGEPAESMHLQLDSLPFHLMIHSRKNGYTYELRYWENRYDREMLEVFMEVMENILSAMFTETSVRKLKYHISSKLYPKHFTATAAKLNASLGIPLVKDVNDDEPVKPYVLDEQGRKKPYGAWGRLYLLDVKTEEEQESIESLYSPGTLYDTGIEARITAKGEVEAMYQAGRTVMRETLTGRYFPNLFELERLCDTFPGIIKTEASVGYGENNLFYLTVRIKTDREIDKEALQGFVAERMGKHMAPAIIEVITE